MTCEDRCAFLIKKAEEVTGRKLGNTRSRADSFIRKMVAYKLSCEGFGTSAIGKAIGQNHATVHYSIGKMKDMLSLQEVYKEEARLLVGFEAALEE